MFNFKYRFRSTFKILSIHFATDQEIEAKSYITLLLPALGYDDKNGDFTWNESISKAYDIGLLYKIQNMPFKRDQIALYSFMIIINFTILLCVVSLFSFFVFYQIC